MKVKELRHKVTSPPLPLLPATIAKRILNGSASVLARVDLISDTSDLEKLQSKSILVGGLEHDFYFSIYGES